jgi:surface polysaccharide O-acyltransferase-like enzyme
LYVIAPFLRVIVRNTTRRMQAGFAGVLIAIGAFDHAAAALAGAGRPTAATQFLPFAGFFVAGWLLRDLPLTRGRVHAAALGFCGSVAATAVLVGVVSTPDGWGAGGRYLYGFLSPTVVVMSLSAFVLLRAVGRRFAVRRPWWPAASALTFGIFLVHPLLLFPLQSWWQLPSPVLLLIAGITVQVVVTLAGSALLTALLQRIPYVRASVG